VRPGPKSHRAPSSAATAQRRNLSPHPPFSNRHWMRLEIAVTSTKHSLGPTSNRHKNTVSWARHSGEFTANPQIHTGRALRALERALRNAAEFGDSRIHTEERHWHDEVPHPFLNGAGTTSSRRVAQSGDGLCALVSRAFERPSSSSSLPSSRAKGGPFTGRRISLRRRFESIPNLAAKPVGTQLIISNRIARRLELPESYRKQTTAPLSNRHKFTHTEETSASPRSPSLECGIAPAALPFNPASPRGSLGQTSLLCRLSPCTLQLQRPPQVANATRDHGACLTQWAPSEAQSAAGATRC
jgi:hypothetical protein